jgi:hypothetical protein
VADPEISKRGGGGAPERGDPQNSKKVLKYLEFIFRVPIRHTMINKLTVKIKKKACEILPEFVAVPWNIVTCTYMYMYIM